MHTTLQTLNTHDIYYSLLLLLASSASASPGSLHAIRKYLSAAGRELDRVNGVPLALDLDSIVDTRYRRSVSSDPAANTEKAALVERSYPVSTDGYDDEDYEYIADEDVVPFFKAPQLYKVRYCTT